MTITHRRKTITTARLLMRSGSAHGGWLASGAWRWRCALGPGGVSALKREGDGATPRGLFRLMAVYYRRDRVRRPITALPIRIMRADDGWSDDRADGNYNRHVRLPYGKGHERLWRSDRLYDLVVVLDHNRRPRVRGHGSCVFMHIAAPDYTPTAGCLSLNQRDLQMLLRAGVTAIRTG